MRSRNRRIRLSALGIAAVVAATAAAPAPAAGSHSGTARESGWTRAWGAALHRPVAPLPGSWPNWAWDGFADQSVRQVVRVGAAGSEVRVEVSNRHGHKPLRLTRASVARAAEGASVRAGSVRELRFGGRSSAVVPVGEQWSSDPVRLPVRPLEKLTVTLHFAGRTGPVTYLEDGLTNAYRAAGDRTHHTSGDAFDETSQAHYLVRGVEVRGRRTEGAVVAFGDSITAGWGSTPGADRRYPDRLGERLLADGRRLSVVNSGISGNMLLTDSLCFGDKGTARFRDDALGLAGVRTAVVMLGVNDIGGGGLPDRGCGVRPVVSAKQLIEGHRKLIRAADRRGITLIGATLTPFKGYGPYYTPEKERVRDAVNHWLRTSGAYGSVVDLDRVLADRRPGHGDEMAPVFDSGDGLHPGDAGMDAIAQAVADHLR
ncbi:SGNH/GDSL hydrolase family protein [Streptomyces uncialis]|uniref:SGNH/GDSL hydrolase family protein n=1 Tax=Streptomyces uncialis TaxID=1048205 RepID=UPI00225A4ABA|nr:SGNH/GDSL hydrolase family protein [Streptomyces uncialis]MCX4661985.1 SGNH/GDSL hydrolase family protein [Streptomyces uncialis]